MGLTPVKTECHNNPKGPILEGFVCVVIHQPIVRAVLLWEKFIQNKET
jgi:hypothetical protein